jgi:hypothetical protein
MSVPERSSLVLSQSFRYNEFCLEVVLKQGFGDEMFHKCDHDST